MARGLNKVQIIGNLGGDPEMRYTPTGKPVTSFNVAVTRAWVKPEGERTEATDWFNVVAWGRLAEICSQYLVKGSRVYVEGRLETRSWEGENGAKYSRTEIVASEVIMLDKRARTEEAAVTLETSSAETARGLNKVQIIGNLGRDPEMRYTPTGKPVTSFSVAVTRAWVKPEGERTEATDWFNVVAWGRLAEICSQYLVKGSLVYVEGRLETRSWEGENGAKYSRTEIVASEVIMLDKRARTEEAAVALETSSADTNTLAEAAADEPPI
jgi:single-strand DNA-binding protein